MQPPFNSHPSTDVKYCPHCGQILAMYMQQCGRCKALQPQQTAHVAPPVSNPIFQNTSSGVSSKIPVSSYCVGCVAILVVCGIVGIFIDSGPTNAGAWIASKHYVQESLKAPSTADFPSSLTADITHQGKVYTVRSYVDSQNGFGAMLRSHWVCKLEYGSNQNWHVNALNINGESIVRDTEPSSSSEQPVPDSP